MRPKSTQYASLEISSVGENSPLRHSIDYGSSDDDKCVENYWLSKEKKYQFSLKTEYGHEKLTRIANFSMELPS